MRAILTVSSVVLFTWGACGQTFEVASVRPSRSLLGPDANNRLVFEAAGIVAENVTLRRLAAEAYDLQMNQVLGPAWIDRNEYDIEAKAGAAATRERLSALLRALLAERFGMKAHRETREMRVYELAIARGGPKTRAMDGPAGSGLHFHGDMRHFADFLAVQLSIPVSDDPTQPGRASGPPVPVFDRTGLEGVYDFPVDIKPEPGSDMFILWQRHLREKMGLRIEVRKGDTDVLAIDSAEKIPTGN